MDENQHTAASTKVVPFKKAALIVDREGGEGPHSDHEGKPEICDTPRSSVEQTVDIWIDADAKSKAEELIPVLRTALRNNTAGALEIGKYLLFIKEDCLKERMFGVWLKDFEARVGINIRSAQRWMRPAKSFAGHLETVSVLSLDLLGKLSKPSLADVRQTVVDMLERGKNSNVSEVIIYAQKHIESNSEPSKEKSKD